MKQSAGRTAGTPYWWTRPRATSDYCAGNT